MGDYCIYTDPQRCIACHSCEVQCKVKNRVPLGASLGKIVILGPKLIDGVPKMTSLFLPCFQCENAWCIDACPTEAIRRRDKDGIVYIVPKLCTGCKACILACPWHIPQWNSETGKVMKCDLCVDRIDENLEPACVTACPTGALSFGRPHEISHKTREAYGHSLLLKNLGM